MAEKKEDSKPKKKVNVGLILTLALAVINLGIVGTGTYMTYAATIGWENPSMREDELVQLRKLASEDDMAPTEQPLIFTMDRITANLSGEPKRMVQVEVNLEMLNRSGFEEVVDVERRARARDRILNILSETSFSDIESIQGKLFLKDEIAKELNSILDQGVVKNVYFSQFVVQ